MMTCVAKAHSFLLLRGIPFHELTKFIDPFLLLQNGLGISSVRLLQTVLLGMFLWVSPARARVSFG